MAEKNTLLMEEEIISALEGMDQIDKIAKGDIPRISEAVFKAKLLPILTNSDGNVNLTAWYEIAGHPLREIEVVDTAGKVLFKLPSLMRRDTYLHKSKNGHNSIFEIFSTAIKKEAIIPALGAKYVEAELLEKMKFSKIEIEEIRHWNSILERYGHPPLLNLKPTKPIEEVSKKEDKDIFSGEFEDL